MTKGENANQNTFLLICPYKDSRIKVLRVLVQRKRERRKRGEEELTSTGGKKEEGEKRGTAAAAAALLGTTAAAGQYEGTGHVCMERGERRDFGALSNEAGASSTSASASTAEEEEERVAMRGKAKHPLFLSVPPPPTDRQSDAEDTEEPPSDQWVTLTSCKSNIPSPPFFLLSLPPI